MTVLLVGPLPPPYGGIPSYVLSLFGADLEGVSFEVFNTAMPATVAPLDREGKGYGGLFENGLRVALRMLAFSLLNYLNFVLLVIRKRPHVVQVFTSSYWGFWRNTAFVVTARVAGRKTIFHLLNAIDDFYDNCSSLGKLGIRCSVRLANLCLVQSPGLAKWFRNNLGDRVVGLWNGIELPPPLTNEKAPMEIAALRGVVGVTVGLVGEAKGTGLILDAMKELLSDGEEVSHIFVGRGRVEEFRRIAEEAGFVDHVWFTGSVDGTVKWSCLRNAQFFCLPSYAEGQPISILEAMAVGLPVISTRVGSIPEIVEHGQSGFLIEPGDVEGLKAAIVRLATEENLRATMGRRSFELFRRRHQLAYLHRNLRRIYRVLEGLVPLAGRNISGTR